MGGSSKRETLKRYNELNDDEEQQRPKENRDQRKSRTQKAART